MPVSKRTGRKYAAGSSTSYGGWEPRTCCICGNPIVKAHNRALRFHMDDATGEAKSWHVEPCERVHGWPGRRRSPR